MKNMIKKMTKSSQKKKDLLGEFINIEQEVGKLPALSAVEKVQFDQDISISHLYHSSKIEGSQLNAERLHKAIHA